MNLVYSQHMANDEMTLKQAMDFLGIKSRITMRKYANTGVIPSRRVEMNGGSWRIFKKSDLVAFKTKQVKDPIPGLGYLPIPKKRLK